MTKIHIHEDDERMRSLYPADAQSDVEQDLDVAKKASLENRAPNGIGFTDIHPIKEPGTTYKTAGISLSAMAAAVDRHLPRVSEFEVGFGDGNPFHYREVDGYCFGFGSHLYIKFDRKDDVVSGIWYDVTTADETELAALRQAFHEINKLQPSMIADYWLNTGGLIDDPAFLDGYFDTIARRSAEIAASTPPKPKLTFLQRIILRLFPR